MKRPNKEYRGWSSFLLYMQDRPLWWWLWLAISLLVLWLFTHPALYFSFWGLPHNR